MKGLDEHGRACEEAFGLISGWYIYSLWEMSTAAGSKWEFGDPESMEIIVTKENAEGIYAYCREIREGYSIGVKKSGMKKIKEARRQAHEYLYAEANDPNTAIERKIELVKLTSKS